MIETDSLTSGTRLMTPAPVSTQEEAAERALLELKDKFAPGEAGAALLGVAAKPVSASSDILNALLALGYNDKEASWAVKQLGADVSVTDGIRQALKFLSKSG